MIPQGNGPSGVPIPGGKRGRDGVPKETAASRKSAAAAAAAGCVCCYVNVLQCFDMLCHVMLCHYNRNHYFL